MSLSDELIRHAIRRLGDPPLQPAGPDYSVDMRRVISASYYALFHLLSEAVVSQIAPNAAPRTANRVHRWLDHREIKKICREVAASPLRSPLRELLGPSASNDLQTVAIHFIKLQEARHSADYDIEYQVSWQEAREYVTLATQAFAAWNRTAPSAESNVFVLSLLLWKNWERERP